jgi:hypothetical protein
MDGPPTPRAAEYISNGDWDDDSSLPISFVSSDVCVGRVGATATGNTVRFCGLSSVECGSRAHATTVFSPGGLFRGPGCT